MGGGAVWRPGTSHVQVGLRGPRGEHCAGGVPQGARVAALRFECVVVFAFEVIVVRAALTYAILW